jgi:hypothetical protein
MSFDVANGILWAVRRTPIFSWFQDFNANALRIILVVARILDFLRLDGIACALISNSTGVARAPIPFS